MNRWQDGKRFHHGLRPKEREDRIAAHPYAGNVNWGPEPKSVDERLDDIQEQIADLTDLVQEALARKNLE